MLKQLIKRPAFCALLVITACAGWYWRPADRSTLFPVIFANDKMGYVNLDGRVVMSDNWDGATAFDKDGRAFVYRDEEGGFIRRDGTIERWIASGVMGARRYGELRQSARIATIVAITQHVREVLIEGKNWTITQTGQMQAMQTRTEWPDVDDLTPRDKDANQEPLYKGASVRSRKWGTRLLFENGDLALVGEKQKFGFVNRFGEIAIPLVWDEAHAFDANGIARVMKNGKRGLIDRTGKLVVALAEWDAMEESDAIGFTAVMKGDKWGAIDRTGKLVIPIRWDVDPTFDKEGLALVQSAGKFGHIDRTGKLLGELEWNEAHTFGKDGLAWVSQFEGCGFINRTGKIVIPLEWDMTDPTFDDQAMMRVSKNDKWGFIDRTGKLNIRLEWDDVHGFIENGTAMVTRNKKWGSIDRTGKVMIPVVWDKIEDFDEKGMASVESNGKSGMIDRAGKIVIALRWDSIGPFDSGDFAHVVQGEKIGFINREDEIIVPADWDVIDPFWQDVTDVKDGIARPLQFCEVGQKDRLGLIDRTGRVVVQPAWEKVRAITDAQSQRCGLVAIRAEPKLEPPAWLKTLREWLPRFFPADDAGRRKVCELHDADGTLIWTSEWRSAWFYPLILTTIATLILLGDATVLWRRRRRPIQLP